MAAFSHVLADEASLRALYRHPSARAAGKQVDRLDDNCRAFLARATFAVLATAGADGSCDASPRGGPPGFLRVLDDERLAFADLSGNNRLDSLANIVSNPHAALLAVVPGLDETLRINGRAYVTTDPAVLDACVVDGRRPRVAVGVAVTAAYIHCAKAFRRGGLWEPERWPDTCDMPPVEAILRDHARLDATPAEVRASLEANYAATIWEVGAEAAPTG